MSELVFFLEEQSAEELLKNLLPRIFTASIKVRFIVFEGKQDLESQIVRRMRGYRVPGAHFVVLRDQDSADCQAVKDQLKEKCKDANHPEAVIRIACHELESWYLADLAAVEKGLGVRGLKDKQNKNPFRNPDEIGSAADKLEELTGYRYQKINGSRSIAPFIELDNQRSRSFKNFIDSLRKINANLSGQRKDKNINV